MNSWLQLSTGIVFLSVLMHFFVSILLKKHDRIISNKTGQDQIKETRLDKFGQVRTSSDKIRLRKQDRTRSNKIGQVLTRTDKFRQDGKF